MVYEDKPVRSFNDRSQDLALSGKTIVRNLGHYCSQNPDISFIVFKEYLCVEDAAPRAPWRTHQRKGQSGSEISPRCERLYIVSDILQKSLDDVALCSEPESRISAGGKRETAAPYPFLYHHRELLSLREKEATGLVKQHITLLLKFLKAGYDAEYREADTQFANGILTDKHIEKLYRPNDIVIEKSETRSMAYVVREWPESEQNVVKISCWSWLYDGMFLQRQDMMLKIGLPLPEDFKISDLSFVPISRASDENIADLRHRGRKFWAMKDQYFGCFSGLDANRTQNHVSLSLQSCDCPKRRLTCSCSTTQEVGNCGAIRFLFWMCHEF